MAARHYTNSLSIERVATNEFSAKIEWRPVADLHALGRRARRHSHDQIAKIARSIQKFGFLNPILIDENGAVLAGLARCEAAKTLDMIHVPVIVASHLSAPEKRAYVLAENKLPELSVWDRDVLAEELRDLAAIDLDFDLEITGFDKIEIEVLTALEMEDGADQTPAVSAKAVSRVGDHWALGPHRLLCGDATNSTCLSTLMDGRLARTTFIDPPYNVAIKGHVTSKTSHREFAMGVGEMSEPGFTDFLATSLRNVAAHMIDGGIIYGCMDWRHASNMLDAQTAAELELMNVCVWAKPNAGQGSFYRSQHELVFVFKVGAGSHLNRIQLGKFGRSRSNVWEYPGVNGLNAQSRADHAAHPTPKPVAMVQDALLDSSEKGDLVIDVFGGGGTTLIAAERCGRHARLIELDPLYVDTIVRRWQDYTGRRATLVASGQTFDQITGERCAQTQHPTPTTQGTRTRVRTRTTARPTLSNQGAI